ncbi:unnamed protein product [Cylicocyclus nassatus]|uniref:Uncharacterized protein n=1 Tax=Cylicocyclus nassatus TaxID=53992 RepID=A0AA36M7P7_CYLNA|nr:unnamed protein product [Cylicocyclus nassatus]
MAAANVTHTRLDLFLAEAKKKDFPLHYTFMDCALRVYGVFVVWLHFVMYLIFKYIHRDIDISLGVDDDETTIASEVVVTEVLPEIEASEKPRNLITVSTKFKKSSKKKEYAKISEKELKSESEKIVKSEKTQENEDEEHLQLMRKFLAQNDMSQPEKPFTVQDLPLWIALMDNTDDDKPTSELRLKMADWLLRRGGMDQLPKGISPVPLRSASSTTKSKGGEEIQYTRAPKGEQVDKLASMERFLEKLNSTEHFSGSGDSLEQVPLVTKVRTTKTTPQSKKSPKRAGAGGEMKEDITQISTRVEEFLNDE